jgi:hypothetical protein
VTFKYLIDAAEDDRLVFEVDGAPLASLHGGPSKRAVLPRASEEATGWAELSFPPAASDTYLAAGAHRFVWRFDRGGQPSAGENTVYLDDITIVGRARRCPCLADADCLDGVACNGEERCTEGVCQTGKARCEPGRVCDAQHDRCVECVVDADCDTGARCVGRACVPAPGACGTDPVACSPPDASAATATTVAAQSAETSTPDAATQAAGHPSEAGWDARAEPRKTPSSCRAVPTRSAAPTSLPAWLVAVFALGLWRGLSQHALAHVAPK